MTETIRRARVEDAQAIAEVHVASWRTTYKGIMSEEELANLSVERRQLMWERQLQGAQVMTFVAENDQGHIVGFASGGPNRTDTENPRETDIYHCEIYAMYLLQEVQRHGLGSRLTRALVEKFREQGYQSMVLWAAADNVSARKFYETLGGTYISMQQLELGGMILDEVSYGWNNLDTI